MSELIWEEYVTVARSFLAVEFDFTKYAYRAYAQARFGNVPLYKGQSHSQYLVYDFTPDVTVDIHEYFGGAMLIEQGENTLVASIAGSVFFERALLPVASFDVKVRVGGALREMDKGWVRVNGELREIEMIEPSIGSGLGGGTVKPM